MNVAVADDRLSVARGPRFRTRVEIDAAHVHRVALDGVEQIRVPLEIAAQARGGREIRMRRDDEAALARFETREIAKRVHRLRRG